MVTITTADQTVQFHGVLIGEGSSHSRHHNHLTNTYVQDGRDPKTNRKYKCHACRWQDVYIYTVNDSDDYVVYTIGMTMVPGELEYTKITRTASPTEVQEVLTVRNREGAYIPAPARRALAQAADKDEDLEDIYRSLPAV